MPFRFLECMPQCFRPMVEDHKQDLKDFGMKSDNAGF